MQTGVNVWCDVKGEGWLVAGGRLGYLVVVVPSVVLLEEDGDRRLRLRQQGNGGVEAGNVRCHHGCKWR